MTKKIIDLESRTVTWEISPDLVEVFEYDRCSDEMKVRLGLHGASQKGGDSYAGAASAIEDTDLTLEEYISNAVKGVIDQLYNDDWTVRATGGGPRVTDLAVAIAEAYAVDMSEAVAKVADMDADTKKAVRNHPAIKPILDRIRAERAAKKAAESKAKGEDAELPAIF